MKKILNISFLLSLLLMFASCEEFEPVFTGKYPVPEDPVVAELKANTTIAELKAMYKGSPVKITKSVMIKGQVTTNDRQGNIYKSFYIQDETGGIEVKIGKNALYNTYKPGQWIYVDCNGLTVGKYNGMPQLGYADPTGEYETSYIDAQYIIDTHIFRGAVADPVKPMEISESDLKNPRYHGSYVTLKGLRYDNGIFCFFYVNPNLGKAEKKNNSNRVFMDEENGNWGVTTWAMSERKFKENLEKGLFDAAQLADKSATVAELRTGTVKDQNGNVKLIDPTANAVSQYFKMGKTGVQIRTSGYAKFSDIEIDPDVLSGKKTVDISGILTIYKNDIQFTLIDLDGVKVN